LTALTLRRFAGGASIGLYESSVFVYQSISVAQAMWAAVRQRRVWIPVNPMDSDEDALYLYVICDRTSTATEVVLNSFPTMTVKPVQLHGTHVGSTTAPTLEPTNARNPAWDVCSTIAPTWAAPPVPTTYVAS
jgi:hypothetical protein